MKKIIISLLSLVVVMTIFAQTESTRTMRIVYNGEVVFSRDVSLIDSITFMKETIDEMQLPYVPLPGEGKTTVVLHIPENTPRGCYAVGTMNGWDINNTDFMFTPVVGAQSERWVACTFDYNYSEDWYDGLRMKVIAIPSDPNASLSWDFQWGRNSSSGWADNVILLDGIGNFDYDYGYNDPPVLIDLENNGIVYIDLRDWYNSPIVQLNPAGLATFHVTVPNNTPANAIISIVGGFAENAWTLGAYLLTRQNDGSYYGQFEIPANFEYKYVVGLEGVEWSWDNSETLGTRKMPVDLHANDTIESWNSIPEPILPGTAGADLASPIVHDFSVTTDNTYPDFTEEYTRSSDFDGTYVLVVSRADAETPTHHLLKVSDLLKGNINKLELSKEGIEGGTHVVSAGCLSHGHIYICNLTTDLGDGENLKVYHYASPEAAPEVWSWDGNLGIDEFGNTIKAFVRLGDNISVNLDESGNGYAFFCGQEGSAEKIYRVQITNFNQFSNPTEIILEEAFPYYGKVNQVDENRYLLTSHYMASTWLIDKEGTMITDIMFGTTPSGLKPQTGEDPRVVKYNGKTYLIFASPYNNVRRIGVGPALYMIDITEGTQVDIQTALQNLSDTLWYDEEGKWEPDFHYSLDVLNIEAESRKIVAACAAQCNAAVVNGKLLVYAAATGAGFVIIEFPAKSETPETPENPDTPTEPEEPTNPSAGIGVFSVSADKQVTFSQGNLQYTQSSNTWSFAENQWDYIGTDNVTGGSVSSGGDGDRKEGTAFADKIDLFGWSTSATYFGVSTSEDYADYAGSFVDWGTNQIGADAPNTWRTLTKDEWDYLLNTRTNASVLKGVAQVNGVNGLILLPDNWTCPSGVIFKSGFHSEKSVEAYGQYQTFSAEQWSKLESAGAVFLPAAGSRAGLGVYRVQDNGYYWSATENGSYLAFHFYFGSDEAGMYNFSRDFGRSVRLVKDIEGANTPEEPTNPEEPDDRPDEFENDTLLNNFTLGGYGLFGSPEMIAGTDTVLEISVGAVNCQLGLISLYAWDDNIVYTGQGFSGMGLFFVADLPVWFITAGDFAGYYISNSTGFYIDSVMTAYTAEAGQLVDLQAYGDAWKALLAAKTQEDSIAAAELIYGAQTGSQFYHMDFNTGVQSYYYGNVKYANIVDDDSLGLLFDLKFEWYDNMNPNRCYGLATKEVDGATVLVEPYDMHVINKEYSNMPTEEKSSAVSAKKTAKNNSVSGKISKLHPMKKIDFPMPMRKVIR